MLPEETEWLGARLPAGPGSGVVLNIGSSTHRYRTVMQPDIDRIIFEPLRARGFNVIHVDRKLDDGVDRVGDLADAAFVAGLKDLRAELVFCNNLLMHLRPDVLGRIVAALTEITPSGSRLYVSSSTVYPFTSDPYDNGLRVNDKQLADLFGSLTVVESATVRGASSFLDEMVRDKALAARIAVRALLPIYKPRNWFELMRYLPKLGTRYAAACAILQKP